MSHDDVPRDERPCIDVCRYDDDTDWCLGCGMTKREKKAWKRAPAYREVIRASLAPRLAALAAEGRVTGPAAGGKRRD